jgi:hypothetical protein
MIGLLTGLLFSGAATAAEIPSQNNVILLTLDGVRWQEVFHGTDPAVDAGKTENPVMPSLWRELLPEGVLFGNPGTASGMTVANDSYLSLPAYQSIMAGFPQEDCFSNQCGAIGVETLPERLQKEISAHRADVVTIASWQTIREAAEHVSGSTWVNTGAEVLEDGGTEPELKELNLRQSADLPPWGDARYDKYTWAHAMRVLKKHRPRFMFISLLDSDEWAHKGDYPKYIDSLKTYDTWIRELSALLEGMGSYGAATTLIVTTDHGRGEGANWGPHGAFFPSSRNIWLYGRNRHTRRTHPAARGGYSHLDIRPTIEALLGLLPRKCHECGQVIRELLP